MCVVRCEMSQVSFCLQLCQDDAALHEVANDLGVKIDVTRRRSPSHTNLGQSYPVMDDPNFEPDIPVARPVATPMTNTAGPVVAETMAPSAESAAPALALPSPDSQPTPTEQDSLPNAPPVELPDSAVVENGGLRQATLREMAGCHFKPYANQPNFPNRQKRSLRQLSLNELAACKFTAKASTEAVHEDPAGAHVWRRPSVFYEASFFVDTSLFQCCTHMNMNACNNKSSQACICESSPAMPLQVEVLEIADSPLPEEPVEHQLEELVDVLQQIEKCRGNSLAICLAYISLSTECKHIQNDQ